MTLPIESTSVEAANVWVYSNSDPTGSAIEYQLVESPGDDPVGTWVAGSWVAGTWDATAGRAQSLTPTMGAAAAVLDPVDTAGDPATFTHGSFYVLFGRLGGTIVKRIDTVQAI